MDVYTRALVGVQEGGKTYLPIDAGRSYIAYENREHKRVNNNAFAFYVMPPHRYGKIFWKHSSLSFIFNTIVSDVSTTHPVQSLAESCRNNRTLHRNIEIWVDFENNPII